MRAFGQLLTVLTLTIVLLIGVANGALAHAVLADHHTSVPADLSASDAPHTAPCDHCPGQAGDHTLSMAASCCPGLAAPMRSPVLRLTAERRVAWHPAALHRPDSRLITPEPPPPKRPA